MTGAPRVNVTAAPDQCPGVAERRVASAEPSCGAMTRPARGAAPGLRVLVRPRGALVAVEPEQARALREQPCPACASAVP